MKEVPNAAIVATNDDHDSSQIQNNDQVLHLDAPPEHNVVQTTARLNSDRDSGWSGTEPGAALQSGHPQAHMHESRKTLEFLRCLKLQSCITKLAFKHS